jgi:trk system potassium uptake protein TrkA
MHVVIAGCSRVGLELTVGLARQGHTISIIDKDPLKFERLPPGFEGQTLVGWAFDREVLEEAGIKDAGAFIAATNGDNSNILSARIAREHYNVDKVVSRIYDPRRAEIYQRLGIKTVATVKWAATQIYDLLFHGIEHEELAIGNGDMLLLRVEIGGNLAGHKVSAVEEEGKAKVVAIDRMGAPSMPAPGACFQEGDVAHVLASRDAIEGLRARLEETHE